MSRIAQFYRQLKQRRVIRTAVVYAALVWGALQVADLLAEAEFISARLVQWLIFAALLGFPLTLILSWFFETPWRERKGLSVLGDISIMLAIAVGVALLAWQQYFTSFTRPTLAILRIEATDTRPDTAAFGQEVADILRRALATRPELRVIELSSSQHPLLTDLPMQQRARALQADYLVSGTINQGDDSLRLNLQLYDGAGELLWSERYEEQLADFTPLLARSFNDLWIQLPLPPDGLEGSRAIISGCPFPRDAEAVRLMVGSGPDVAAAIADLSQLMVRHPDNGMLYRARAQRYMRQMAEAPVNRHPVIDRLIMQDMQSLADFCPAQPEPALRRLHTTHAIEDQSTDLEALLAAYPNDARIRLLASRALLDRMQDDKAQAVAAAAWHLDPLGITPRCVYAGMLGEHGDSEGARRVLAHGTDLGLETAICGITSAVR